MTVLPYVPTNALIALVVFFAYLAVLAAITAFFSVGRHRDDILEDDR